MVGEVPPLNENLYFLFLTNRRQMLRLSRISEPSPDPENGGHIPGHIPFCVHKLGGFISGIILNAGDSGAIHDPVPGSKGCCYGKGINHCFFSPAGLSNRIHISLHYPGGSFGNLAHIPEDWFSLSSTGAVSTSSSNAFRVATGTPNRSARVLWIL